MSDVEAGILGTMSWTHGRRVVFHIVVLLAIVVYQNGLITIGLKTSHPLLIWVLQMFSTTPSDPILALLLTSEEDYVSPVKL